MNYYVTPQRSEGSAVALAESPDRMLAAPPGEPMPGPISWELPAMSPVELPDTDDAMSLGTGAADTSVALIGHGLHEGDGPPSHEAAPWDDSRWVDDPAPVPDRDPRITGEWSLGPVGRTRSVALLVTLSVLTLGLAAVTWFRRANREMRDFDPRMTVRPGRTLLAMSLPTVLPLLAALGAGARIVADHLDRPVDLPVRASLTHWLVLAPVMSPWLCLLIPFGVVAAAMTFERIRVVEDRAGMAPELQTRPVASLGWLLVPVVGVIILAARGQSRLNRAWGVARP